MFPRNPLRTWVPLALLLVVVSAAWAPPEPPVAPRTEGIEAAAAANLGGELVLSGLSLSAAEYSPAIAYNSVRDQYLAVWEVAWSDSYHDIYARRVSGDGRLLSEFSLASPPFYRSQTNPAVAYDPDRDRFLVVWAYDVSGDGSNWDVYGVFIPWDGPQGEVYDYFPICSWSGSDESHPAVAYGRGQQEFLIVWRSEAEHVPGYISGVRINAATGGFPAGDGFTISSGPQIRDFPDVAYNLARNEYLVTWDMELSASDIDIYGERLTGNGVSLTGGNKIPPDVGEFVIAGWGDFEAAPAVAACAAEDQYLVAWQSDQGTGGTDYAIYARYLNGDAVPGFLPLIDDTTSPELNVDVDCNLAGNRYLLAWQSRYTNVRYGIIARSAWPDGSLGPYVEVRPPVEVRHREYPAVAGGRTGFLVAWEHERDSDGNRDIHGRLVQYRLHLPLVLRKNP